MLSQNQIHSMFSNKKKNHFCSLFTNQVILKRQFRFGTKRNVIRHNNKNNPLVYIYGVVWGDRMRVFPLLTFVDSGQTSTYLHNRSQFQRSLYFPGLLDRPTCNSPCACCCLCNIWMSSLTYKNLQSHRSLSVRKKS